MTFRWLLFWLSGCLLLWSLFVAVSWWSGTGFLLCGAGWYWLGRRKALELDGPKGRQ